MSGIRQQGPPLIAFLRFSVINFPDFLKGLPTVLFNPHRYLREMRHLLMLAWHADTEKHPMLLRQIFPVISRYGPGIAAHFSDYCRLKDYFHQPDKPALR